MSGYPVARYRPTRTPDGEGGFTEALGTGLTVYGTIEFHSDKTSLLLDAEEDVLVGDIIGVSDDGRPEARYRVTISKRLGGTRYRTLTLERLDRPIAP